MWIHDEDKLHSSRQHKNATRLIYNDRAAQSLQSHSS